MNSKATLIENGLARRVRKIGIGVVAENDVLKGLVGVVFKYISRGGGSVRYSRHRVSGPCGAGSLPTNLNANTGVR